MRKAGSSQLEAQPSPAECEDAVADHASQPGVQGCPLQDHGQIAVCHEWVAHLDLRPELVDRDPASELVTGVHVLAAQVVGRPDPAGKVVRLECGERMLRLGSGDQRNRIPANLYTLKYTQGVEDDWF